ncbi:MAG: tetratricopeptide repeat protein [Pyrinomonadaceae bacterium]|nr:tetratricopeptide repeat protein [Chloracidobacterium sp.]
MKQVFTIVVLSVLVGFGFGCSGNSSNVAANSETVAAESPFANITDPTAALAEGDRLFDENQTELAIQAYQQAIKLNPDLAEGHFKLGIAYALLEMQYEQTGTVDPGNPDARSKPRSQKSFEKAVEAYKKWIAANPNDDTAHYNLARTYNKLNKDEEAEKEFRQAVKLKPEDSEYQTELGSILIKLAQYREAIVPLKKAIELDAGNERAASLLEDAEAGRQRIDYVGKDSNANRASSGSNSNSAANTNANSASNTSTNSAVKPPPANTAKPPKPEVKETPPKADKNEKRGKKG